MVQESGTIRSGYLGIDGKRTRAESETLLSRARMPSAAFSSKLTLGTAWLCAGVDGASNRSH